MSAASALHSMSLPPLHSLDRAHNMSSYEGAPSSPLQGHKKDQEIYARLVNVVHQPLHVTDMALIISHVVTASPILDQRYSDPFNAINLVNASWQLQAVVDRAWVQQDFQTLRALKILQPPSPGTHQPVGGAPMVRKLSPHALQIAWRMEFKGRAASLLTKAIDDLFLPSIYAKLLPVVQSSGMGKSRTIDEVAKIRITFPLCLRKELPPGNAAYPRADRQVRNHLVLPFHGIPHLSSTAGYEDNSASGENFMAGLEYQGMPKESFIVDPENQSDVRRKLAVLLDALLREGCALVKRLCNGQGQILYEDLARRFYDYFDSEIRRQAFYARVVEKALAQRKAPSSVEFLATFCAFSDACRIHSLPLKGFASRFPVVLYIDEVDTLFVKATDGKTVYDELCSLLGDFKESQLAVVCLSTTSKLSSIASTPSISNSHRARNSPISSPFTLFGFDTFAPKIVENTLALYDVMGFEFVAGFGRPLWSTYLHSLKSQGTLSPLIIAESVLDLAKDKLVLGWRRTGPLSLEGAIAVLSVRVLLDIEPDSTESRNMIEGLVASHMRIAFTFPEHREYMHTGTPSEPLLAEAASILMNSTASWDDEETRTVEVVEGMGMSSTVGEAATTQASSNWGDFGQYMLALSTFFKKGFTLRGERGEFMGRLMDILAIDAAVKNIGHSLTPHRYRLESPLVWCAPVPVLKFLQHLLGKKNLEQIKTLLPVNSKEIDSKFLTLTLEEAFANAYVHFTHYQRAKDPSILQVKYLWAYWARGIALQLKPGQILSDRALPIHWDTFDGTGITAPESPSTGGEAGHLKLGRHTCSVILHQDKNSSIASASIRPQKPSELNLFEGVEPKPVLTFNHVYGFEGEPTIKVKPSSSRRTYGQNKPPYEAPIYEVSILGFHGSNYEPIRIRPEPWRFKALLAESDVFQDQTNQDAESLQALRQFLPTHGTETMHWASLVDE